MKRGNRIILIVTAFTAIVSFSLFLIAVANGWFGETGDTGAVFCEAEHTGLIKQPANTWSNLAFMFFGLLIAFQLSAGKFSENRNSITQNIFYGTFFSCLVVLLGPGSMAMHATQTPVGGFFDMLSMYLVASFMTAYALQRYFNLSTVYFILIFSGALISCIIANFSDVDFIFEHFGNTAFAFYILLAIVVEMLNTYQKRLQHTRAWGFGGIAFLLTAFIIWNLSRTDAPFCDPSSIVQGHAIWHILDACAAYCLFRYYASEKI